MKQTAVEWLFEKLPTIDKYDPYYSDIIKQAKEMEKQQEKDKLIDFLYWMNIVSAKHPMALETDTDDIVDMYLNKFFKQ